MHLLVDGYGADPNLLADQTLIAEFLDEFPSLIGMNKISSPHVYNYVGEVPEDWGVSGFVVIAESHISIHTFPDRRYVNIDIFSVEDAKWIEEKKVWIKKFGSKLEEEFSQGN